MHPAVPVSLALNLLPSQMKCIKVSLYSSSKELISEEVICPLSELTKYMIKHEQNIALFPVKYFDKTKSYFEN